MVPIYNSYRMPTWSPPHFNAMTRLFLTAIFCTLLFSSSNVRADHHKLITEVKKIKTQVMQDLKNRKTSGTNSFIWEKSDDDKMVSTQVFKNDSGSYVETKDSWIEISTRVK